MTNDAKRTKRSPLISALMGLPACRRQMVATLQEGADSESLVAEMRQVEGVIGIEPSPDPSQRSCMLTVFVSAEARVLDALEAHPAVVRVTIDNETPIHVMPVTGIESAQLKAALEELPSVMRVTPSSERRVPRNLGPLVAWVCDDDVARMYPIIKNLPGVAWARIPPADTP